MSRRVFPKSNCSQFFLSFLSENSRKTSKKTSMTEKIMVVIYDLGPSCENSVQKDFKNKSCLRL